MNFRQSFFSGVMLLAFGQVAFSQELDKAVDWPQWRGPMRDGRFQGPKWPEQLTKDNFREVWKVPLGPSYSGPVIALDRVFVTETKDRKLEIVRALDRATGKQLWEASWEGSMSVPFFAAANGDWIRSTPAYDGESLFVGGMRDVLVCLDAQTGTIRWSYDFVKETKSAVPSFGFVCSPLLDDKHVYVQAGASFAKLEKKTGKLVWQTLKDNGTMMASAFSSPAFAELGGKKQILVQTRTLLAGIDPSTGAVLWSEKVPAMRDMNILTPTLQGDGIFTSAYGGKSFFYRVRSDSESPRVETAWTNKQQAYMSSPVIIAGHAYLHLRPQNVTCIDLKDGTTKWTTSERFGQYWSMIFQGERILALDERGLLYLVKANPERYEQISQLQISERPTWAHLAMSGREVFVRELRALTVSRWE